MSAPRTRKFEQNSEKFVEVSEREVPIIEKARKGGKIQVIWVNNDDNNTGYCIEPASIVADGWDHIVDDDGTGCIQIEIVRHKKLLETIKANNLVKYPATLVAAMGIEMDVYAQPYQADEVNRGRNNQIASRLTTDLKKGFEPHRVVGKALFVRTCQGKPVSLTACNFVRACCFLDDVRAVYKDDKGPMDPALLKKAFEYYNPFLNDTMLRDGWNLNGRAVAKEGTSEGLQRVNNYDLM
ncbi:hypothetical protein SARC_08851 [Sphaeroforma arctica JP610]|uniref:Uncharacterized protein n=1 Tax=Sphaeroforma arctica JP610 TaxID=667725 RepID=A0A0L0FRY4_9EUKA|nr:hypothetical protein SARC_08851 [Sphaeroforma arctica JP610]KNC78728.1 hypothetical protein SARC_08851 [Sphaeroforma arctica JP610]|eukprot:XP_014152630.1 hypothetical protein SARC_08851 [Sphaeroforma arctica JP610]